MAEMLENLKETLGGKILRIEERSPKRIYLEVDPGDIRAFCAFMSKAGARLATATGIDDTPHGFEIIYHFSDDSTGTILSLRVRIANREKPEIDSLTEVVPAANWIEREMWEMLGINFRGHPDLRRLLLPDDWPQGVYPLRRDFKLKEHEREKEINE